MANIKGMLAKAVIVSCVAALPAYAAVRPPVISTAGDDPEFNNTGLTTIAPIDGRGYSLNAQFDTLYDSNMLRLGNGFALRPGTQRADVRMSPMVTGRVGVPIGRQQFFAGVLIGGDIFAANGQLNRHRIIAGGGLNLAAGRACTATIAADFASRNILLSDVAELIPNAQDTLGYGLSANCATSTGLGAGITVRQINTTNSAPSRIGFDVNSTLISPQISYGRPTLGQFSLTANLNYVTYPQRTILTTDGLIENDRVNIFSGRFGYQRMLGTRLSLTAGISYLQSSPQPNVILQEDSELGFFFPLERSSFSGMGYDASVSYTPSPRLSAIVAFSRNSSASPNVGALYQVNTRFGADINYQLGSSIRLGLGGSYLINDYEGSFTSPTETIPRSKDNIGRVYGRISYTPPRPWEVSLLLAYQSRVSDPAEFSFDSFSALLSLSFTFGRQS
jgi:hypothetical protein